MLYILLKLFFILRIKDKKKLKNVIYKKMDMECKFCKRALTECKLRSTCGHFICNKCLGREILLRKFSPLSSTKEVKISCSCESGEFDISYKDCLENLKASQTKLQQKILCKEHNKNVINYCQDCKIWLCEECKSNFHNNYFPNHKLLSSDKMNNSKCFYHKGQIKNIFCKDCNTLICKECSEDDNHNYHSTFTVEEFKTMVKNKSKLLNFNNYNKIYNFICEKEQTFVNEFIEDIESTKKYIDQALESLNVLKQNYINKTKEQINNLQEIFSIIKQTYENFYNEMSCEKIDVGSFDFLDSVREELNNIKYESYNKKELTKACEYLNKIYKDQFYKLQFSFKPMEYINNQTILSRAPLTYIIELENYKDRAFICGLNNGYIEMYSKENKEYKRISEVQAHNGSITVLSELSHQDEPGFLSGSNDKSIKIWSYDEESNNYTNKKTTSRTNDDDNNNLIKLKCLYTLDNLHKGSIISLCEMENGKIASSGSDNKILIWKVKDKSEEFINIRERVKYERSLISINENTLISGSSDGNVKLWDVSTGELKKIFTGHSKSVTCLSKISDDKIISGGSDSLIIVWDLNKKKNNKILKGHQKGIIQIWYSSQGILASCSFDNTIKIWDMESLSCIGTIFNAHSNMIYGVICYSKEIVSVGNDRKIQLFKNTIKDEDGDNYADFE